MYVTREIVLIIKQGQEWHNPTHQNERNKLENPQQRSIIEAGIPLQINPGMKPNMKIRA